MAFPLVIRMFLSYFQRFLNKTIDNDYAKDLQNKFDLYG